MAGLGPAIHVDVRIAALRKWRRRLHEIVRVLKPTSHVTAWMAGTSATMTRIASNKRLDLSAEGGRTPTAPGSVPLRHVFDRARHLVDDLVDLVLADDERRGQLDRVAGHPQHDVRLVE
jgi:hypothetical protein